MKADALLKAYPNNTDYELTKNELRYNTDDWISFIQFCIKDDRIYQIVVGKNL